jgi:hypothetical protein
MMISVMMPWVTNLLSNHCTLPPCDFCSPRKMPPPSRRHIKLSAFRDSSVTQSSTFRLLRPLLPGDTSVAPAFAAQFPQIAASPVLRVYLMLSSA